MKTNRLLRYKHIIYKLRNPSTFDEINKYLEMKSDFGKDLTISKRTFIRDKEDILSLFSIEIVYNNEINKYEISDKEDINKKNKLLEAIDTLHLPNMKKELLKNIHLERVRHKGLENLEVLLNAIENRLCVTFQYEKYWDETKTNREVQPYALKEFDTRWYLIAKEVNGKIKTFGLDRITEIKVTENNFDIPDSFDVNVMFANSFGIITPPDQKIEEVVLSFTYEQGRYVQSLPLHHSQEILLNTHEELQIKLTLHITFDFVMKLLSYGSSVKVLRPASLREEVKGEYERALSHYVS